MIGEEIKSYRFGTNLSLNKWWQKCDFWLNYPFNIGNKTKLSPTLLFYAEADTLKNGRAKCLRDKEAHRVSCVLSHGLFWNFSPLSVLF